MTPFYDDLSWDVTPRWKPRPTAGGIGNRKRKRLVDWVDLRASKDGPCRVCGFGPPSHLHHLVGRGRGGQDVEENLVPLCAPCHDRVERHNRASCSALREALTVHEFLYVLDVLGADRMDARYPKEKRKK